MATAKIKKNRSANFTFEDQQRLVRLVKNHASVLECKRTDKYSWQQKDSEWALLAIEFNAGTSSVPRSGPILKAKFKNMKKEYRNHKGNVRQSQYATGGGPPDDIKPYPFEDDIRELLALSTEGLFNAHDSDSIVSQKQNEARKKTAPETKKAEDIDSDGVELDLEQVGTKLDIGDIPIILAEDFVNNAQNQVTHRAINPDWSTYTPDMLRQPKHSALVLPRGARLTNQTSIADVKVPEKKTADSLPCLPSTNLQDSTKEKRIFQTNRIRPSLEKFKAKKPASATNNKYSLLAESKKNLADLQLELVKEELAMKKGLNEKENILIDMKIEGQRLKNKLLQKQIDAL